VPCTNDSSGRAASDRFLPQISSSSRESARVYETRGHGLRIIDMGEGSSLWSKSCRRALSSRSIPQRRCAPKHPYSVTSAGARSHLQWSPYVAQNLIRNANRRSVCGVSSTALRNWRDSIRLKSRKDLRAGHIRLSDVQCTRALRELKTMKTIVLGTNLRT